MMEALTHYSNMLTIDPLSVVGFCNRSQAYYKLKSFIFLIKMKRHIFNRLSKWAP